MEPDTTPEQRPPTAETLPVELVRLVFEASLRPGHRALQTRLVARVVHDWLEPLFWSTVSLKTGDSEEKLMYISRHAERIAPHIRNLDAASYALPRHLIDHLRNVRKLRVCPPYGMVGAQTSTTILSQAMIFADDVEITTQTLPGVNIRWVPGLHCARLTRMHVHLSHITTCLYDADYHPWRIREDFLSFVGWVTKLRVSEDFLTFRHEGVEMARTLLEKPNLAILLLSIRIQHHNDFSTANETRALLSTVDDPRLHVCTTLDKTAMTWDERAQLDEDAFDRVRWSADWRETPWVSYDCTEEACPPTSRFERYKCGHSDMT